MASSGECYLDTQQLCDYVLLRHVNVSKDAESEKLYRKWTRLWVVVHSQVSPLHCFLGYCKKESKWLQDSQSIVKYPLSEFTLSMLSTKKHDKVMKLDLPLLTVELSFDSQTKMDQYFKILSGVSMRYHVDLVRAPEHPEREGDYVVEDCSTSYRVWKVLGDSRGELNWEWNLKTIRRIHYHKNVEKLEVEAGRLSQTGEGHFYFTGRHAYHLFEAMKTELMARAQQKIQSQQQQQNRSLPPSSPSSPPSSPPSSSSSSGSSSLPGKSNLARSSSVASAMKPKSMAADPHLSSSRPLPTSSPHQQNDGTSGHKPLTAHLSHSNGALPSRGIASVEETDTSSEDYSPSDNSSSFTGTGSIHDWTTPSPAFDRPPFLPPRLTDGRPFSPCSTTSSSSSSASGYNVPRRLFNQMSSSSNPPVHYMQVKREEMDGDSEYMTMNAAVRSRLHHTSDSGRGTMDKDDGEGGGGEGEEDETGYTDMHSARALADGATTTTTTTTTTEYIDQYMHMVPLGDNQTATLTRSRPPHHHPAASSRSTSVPPTHPPAVPPQVAKRFRELDIIKSSCPGGGSSSSSNTFPGARREATNS